MQRNDLKNLKKKKFSFIDEREVDKMLSAMDKNESNTDAVQQRIENNRAALRAGEWKR